MRKIMSQQTLVLGLVLSAPWTLNKSLLPFVKWYSDRVNIFFLKSSILWFYYTACWSPFPSRKEHKNLCDHFNRTKELCPFGSNADLLSYTHICCFPKNMYSLGEHPLKSPNWPTRFISTLEQRKYPLDVEHLQYAGVAQCTNCPPVFYHVTSISPGVKPSWGMARAGDTSYPL